MGTLAIQTDFIIYKIAVPSSCCLIVLWNFRKTFADNKDVIFIIFAFIFSMIGDYFLSKKKSHDMFFVYGIAAYWGAHLGYSLFALKNGRLHKGALLLFGLFFVPYYLLALHPAIQSLVLSISVLFYLGISIVALALAFGLTISFPQKLFYIIGITLIVVSDTFISFNEFLRFRFFNDFILPTYYLAHISITFSLIIRHNLTFK